MFKTSGALSARSMVTSLAIHVVVLAVLMLVPAQTLLRSAPAKRNVDIVFYRPPEIAIPVPAVPLRDAANGMMPDAPGLGAPAPAVKPKPNAPAGPDGPGKPELPPGPEEGFRTEAQPQPEPKARWEAPASWHSRTRSRAWHRTRSRRVSEPMRVTVPPMTWAGHRHAPR